MSLSRSAPHAKQRWIGALSAIVVATLLIGATAAALVDGTLTTAQLGGFGIEGNMTTAPDTYDWQNAGGDPAGANACSVLGFPGFANPGGPLNLSCANDKPTGQSDNSLNGKEQDSNVQAVCGSIPNQKSDLQSFYVASQSVGAPAYPAGTPHSIVYLGWTRTNTLGSADMDFEFNQLPQDSNLSLATCPSGNGTTVYPNRMDGDLLVQYLFGGNDITIQLSTWITDNATQGPCATSTSAPCWSAPEDLTAAGTANGAINDETTAGQFSCLTPNNKTTSGCIVNELSGGNLLPETFGEAGIDLTAALQGSGCETFGSVYLKSRSSAVFTDAMKDYIAPIPVNITNCVTPTVTTTLSPSPASVALGVSVTDTATISGFLGSNPPGGTVTFNVYSGSGAAVCVGTPLLSIAGSALSASGSNAISTATITDGNDLLPGSYEVQASYSGDGGTNLPAKSRCGSEPITVSPVTPTISTQASPTTAITVGTPTVIGDTATLGGLVAGVAPTGSVTFTLYSVCPSGGGAGTLASPAAGGTVSVSAAGVATFTTSPGTWTPTTIGTYSWAFSYSGDTNYNSVSGCGGTNETLTVVAITPGLATTQRVVPQDRVTFSGADADAGPITGSVTFRLYVDVGHATNKCGSAAGTPVYSETINGVNSNTSATYGTLNSGDPGTGGISFSAPSGVTLRWTVQFTSSSANYSSVAESACSSEPIVISFTNPT